jgi:class 3 adenylate cyclase
MTIAVTLTIITSLLLLAAVFLFLYQRQRIKELKEKTGFAASSESLVKVEMNGTDAPADIARSFNILGEKLMHYIKLNKQLSGVSSEKSLLDKKVQTFEDSISQVNLLTDIGRKITSSLNIEDVALKLFKYINSSMAANEVNLLISRDGDKRYFNVVNGKIMHIADIAWRSDKDNILNWSFDNNKEAFLNDAPADYGQYVFKPVKMQDGTAAGSVITVPLSISDKMIGAVSVLSASKNAYSEFHLDFTRSISSYAAVAVDNAFLYDRLGEEKQKSEELLLNILPNEVASELKRSGRSEARQYDHVSVIFTDFVNFTSITENMSPKELVREIDIFFKGFDAIIGKNKLEKIKTIGDAYLAVCGLPELEKNHAVHAVQAAKDIVQFIREKKKEGGLFDIRIGINSGPVVAGIVGVKKFAYDIWGDTVNTAARMEQNSEAGKINISGSTYELVKDHFECEHRGKIAAKNKGEIDMYFVKS